MKTIHKTRQTIDQEINTLCRLLSETVGENMTVVREKPAKGSSCKGIISIFSRGLAGSPEEERGIKVSSIARYAFYPDTLDPARIGSVAIYGDNTGAWYITLRQQTTLFGHPIIGISIEQGRRPFIDVRLGA